MQEASASNPPPHSRTLVLPVREPTVFAIARFLLVVGVRGLSRGVGGDQGADDVWGDSSGCKGLRSE